MSNIGKHVIAAVYTHIILVVVVASLTFSVQAAELPPMILWNVTFDSGVSEIGLGGVAIGPDGNPVFAGHSYVAPPKAIWHLRKYDGATGALLWSVTVDDGLGGPSLAFAVAVGQDGHPVVTGDSCTPQRICNIRTMKFDGATGSVLWNVTFNSGERDVGYAVAVGGDGNPVIGGGACVQTPARGCDFLVIKYNGVTGDVLWARLFDSGADNEFLIGAAVGPDGNPVVTGNRCNPAGTNPQNCRGTVIKYNGITGSTLWSVFENGGVPPPAFTTATSIAAGVTIGPDGHPVVGGSSCYPECDFWTRKYNGATGNIVWSMPSNAGERDSRISGAGAAVGPDGNPVVTGRDIGNIRTIKYDGATGLILWNVIFDSGGQDFGHGVAIGQDKSPVLAAISCSPNCIFRVIKYQLTPLTVGIDIKPGSFPNSINLSAAGVVPVAILSSETFDATQVNPATVTLAGASVKLIGKGDKYSCGTQDADGNGLLDLVCHVVTDQFQIVIGDSIAVLEGHTFGGIAIRGEDSILIVQD